MPEPDKTPAPEVPLTRKEKEELLKQMYSLPHWIAIVRLLGHKAMHMDEARKNIKPIADKYGKEPVAKACEVLVEIFTEGKEPFARLKSHIRRMAFQILGPEPTLASPTVPPAPESQAESVPSPEKKRRRTRTAASAPPPAAVKNDPASSNGRSAIMQQYLEAKEKYPNMILLFRIGDFYEVFNDDAEECHKRLGLTLTTRDQDIKMAGFPHHQLEVYLHKLLKEELRVAVCDQIDEGMKQTRREVTRIVPELMDEEAKPIKQSRHFVLKKFQEWMSAGGMAFVAIEDVKRTTPAVTPFVGSLDFIVLRGEAKLLVTVRPHLQARHLKAIDELQKLFGLEYRPVRVWPADGPQGWEWKEHPVDKAVGEKTNRTTPEDLPAAEKLAETPAPGELF